MRLLRKAALIALQGDLRGLLQACYQRAVYKRWRVRLFLASGTVGASETSWPSGFRYEMLPATQSLGTGVLHALKVADAWGLWNDLDKQDRLYAVWVGDRIASFGAVFEESPQRMVLGLPQNAMLIGGCATLKEFRGRSLYKLALNETVRQLRHAAAGPIYVEVREDNHASIRGVLGAGLSDLGVVDTSIWFGTFALRGGRLHTIQRGGSS
jgi:hypothetical protein